MKGEKVEITVWASKRVIQAFILREVLVKVLDAVPEETAITFKLEGIKEG